MHILVSGTIISAILFLYLPSTREWSLFMHNQHIVTEINYPVNTNIFMHEAVISTFSDARIKLLVNSFCFVTAGGANRRAKV